MRERIDRDQVYTKLVAGQHDPEYHFVKMPDYGQKGWYWAVSSLNAFRNRMGKRAVRCVVLEDGREAVQCKALSFHWYGESIRAHESRKEIYAKSGITIEGPEFHHESIWDFYKHIGFDHKKNRFDVEPVEIKRAKS